MKPVGFVLLVYVLVLLLVKLFGHLEAAKYEREILFDLERRVIALEKVR